MNIETQAKIEAAKTNKSTFIDLGNCGLIEFPSELMSLPWLEEVNLGDVYQRKHNSREFIRSENWGKFNAISNIPEEFGKVMQNLRFLSINHNPLGQANKIPHLEKLEYLNLGNTEPLDLGELEVISNLESLIFQGKGLRSLKGISKAERLINLQLYATDINDFEEITHLHALQVLVIHHNPKMDLGFLSELKQLRSLSLNKIAVEDLSPLRELKNLKELRIRKTKVSDISIVQDLPNLDILEISGAPVQNLGPAHQMISRGIPILDKEFATNDGEKGIYLKDCPIENPPLNILFRGNSAVTDFFQQKDLHTTTGLFETKAVIIGEPEAGKTTLMEKLIDPEGTGGNLPSTLGFNIKPWSFLHPDKPDALFTANIWDFGGQDIQYSTHHFFLNPNSYFILVDRARNGLTRFDYWFQTVEKLGKNGSKVLVVINEFDIDSTAGSFETHEYSKRYPNLHISSVNLNIKSDPEALSKLIENLKTEMATMPHVREKLPESWISVRNDLIKLRADGKEKISLEEFTSICQHHGIDNVESQRNLSATLHERGLIVHFWSDETVSGLDHLVILKPQWAAKAVYELLDKQFRGKKGVFQESDLQSCWKEYGADFDDLKTLLLKDRFEVCFNTRMDGKEVYFAPIMLPNYPPMPIKGWTTEKTVKLRYSYPFMPQGIICRIIIHLSEYIRQSEGQLYVWKNGIFLEHNGAYGLVYLEDNGPSLSYIQIELTGPPILINQLSGYTEHAVKKVNNHPFRSLSSVLQIPCVCDLCHASDEPYYFDYNHIVTEGPDLLQCQKNFRMINFQELVSGIPEMAVQGRDDAKVKEKRVKTIEENTMNQAIQAQADLKRTQKRNRRLQLGAISSSALLTFLITGFGWSAWLMGSILGVVVGCLVAYLFYRFDPRMRFRRTTQLFAMLATTNIVGSAIAISFTSSAPEMFSFKLDFGDAALTTVAYALCSAVFGVLDYLERRKR